MKCILWRESWETGALLVEREMELANPPRVIETARDPAMDRAPVTVSAREAPLPRRSMDCATFSRDRWTLFRVDDYGMGPAHYIRAVGRAKE